METHALVVQYDAASLEEKHNLQYELIQLAVSETAEMFGRLDAAKRLEKGRLKEIVCADILKNIMDDTSYELKDYIHYIDIFGEFTDPSLLADIARTAKNMDIRLEAMKRLKGK